MLAVLPFQPLGLVVVVDDDPAVRNALGFRLRVEGFAVALHASGREFLEAPRPSRHACLVIDHGMPDMSGLEVVAELARRGETMPTVLVTAAPTRPLQRAARALGVAGVIEKPLLGNELMEVVVRLLAGHEPA